MNLRLCAECCAEYSTARKAGRNPCALALTSWFLSSVIPSRVDLIERLKQPAVRRMRQVVILGVRYELLQHQPSLVAYLRKMKLQIGFNVKGGDEGHNS